MFTGNYASVGGGMANYGGARPVMEGCIFEDNEAGHGGGMYNANCSPVVENCVFAGNAAVVTAGNGWGGGVCNTGAEGSGWFRNCVFYNNEGVKGGATWNSTWGAVPQYINCTIFSNSASGEGGGIYNRFASPAVTNSIIWNNNDGVSGDSDGDEIYNYYERPVPPPPPSFRCCDIKGGLNGSRSGGLDAADGGYNIDASPEFTDAAHPKGTIDGIWMTGDDGLRLNDDSPCIDAADGDASPQRDIRGVSRYDEPGATGGVGQPDYVEIGAYEYHPVEVHFSGWIIDDVYDPSYGVWLSKAFVDDTYSDIIVGLGAYADTEDAISQAVYYTLDSIAIRDGVKLTVWSGENFTGDILLEQKGPAVIYNVRWNDPHEYWPVWNAMTEDWEPAMLQYEFPQEVREWSETDMWANDYLWEKGSFKIE